MPNDIDLQEVLRQNLRVLLAMRRMTHTDLANAIGSDRSTIAKRMNGHRDWSLQDLARLAGAFDMPIERLIGETALLLGTVPARMTGTDDTYGTRVTARVTSEYVSGNTADVIQFPQVRKPRTGYYSKRIAKTRTSSRPRTHRSSRHPFAEAAV